MNADLIRVLSTTLQMNADEISIPAFEVDINDSMEPTNAVGILHKPALFCDIRYFCST